MIEGISFAFAIQVLSHPLLCSSVPAPPLCPAVPFLRDALQRLSSAMPIISWPLPFIAGVSYATAFRGSPCFSVAVHGELSNSVATVRFSLASPRSTFPLPFWAIPFLAIPSLFSAFHLSAIPWHRSSRVRSSRVRFSSASPRFALPLQCASQPIHSSALPCFSIACLRAAFIAIP